MSARVRDVLGGALGELPHEPTEKWVRATIADRVVVDSKRRCWSGSRGESCPL
jgi:hypothetical protein